jgi:predicted ATPase
VVIHGDRFPTRQFFPFSVPILGEAQQIVFRRPVALFAGENGTGKSTLLDAIARRCGVPVWDKPRRHEAHRNPYETQLSAYLSVEWVAGKVAGSLFRAETFREFGDFLDDIALCDPGRLPFHGGRVLNTLSHGQGFLAYFEARFDGKGIYFLDEPEAALSPASQLRFIAVLQRLEERGHAQFVIATHSPFLLAYPGAQILSFDTPQIAEVRYEDTGTYQLYHRFFSGYAAPQQAPSDCRRRGMGDDRSAQTAQFRQKPQATRLPS